MRNTTRIKRLKQLSHMLKNHKKIFKTVKFDINTWVDEQHCDDKACVTGSCKTAACALGSAAIYPPFMKVGLKIFDSIPAYKGSEDFWAGAIFFGIEEWESRQLFDPSLYNVRNPQARTVAKRVDILIKQYRKAA